MKIIATTVFALVSFSLAAGPRISVLGDSYSTYEGVIPQGNCSRYSVPCIDLVSIAKQKSHPSIAGMKSIADQVTAAVQKQ